VRGLTSDSEADWASATLPQGFGVSRPTRAGRARIRTAAFAAGTCCIVALLVAPTAASEDHRLDVEVISSRPDAVSGGDALVRVDLPPGVPPSSVRVSVDGEDVSGAFRVYRGDLVGLVDGLDPGTHQVTADAPGAGAETVDVVAHPGAGPVLAGPREEPFACESEEFRTVVGVRLGPPTDADCSVDTRLDHVYRTTGGAFRPLPEGETRPADLAWTTTLDDERVPYIVRVQTGTVNRGIYEFAVLHDPQTEPAPDTFTRTRGWNKRLVYTLGGGCRAGWYRQGNSTGGVLVDSLLSRGFAVASNSLNVFGHNCNDLLAAETLTMTREEFIETYGLPRYTIGWGCSGGSYQAHQIADNYPGLLDGIIAGCSFPDVGFATSQMLADARLLHRYFTLTDPDGFTPEQRQAVAGFGVPAALAPMSDGAKRLDPDAEFDGSVPAAWRYDAVANPDGARATIWDHTRNAYGVDDDTGFALRPLDNVGAQYGLRALQDGTITIDQFLDLNEEIGGLDIDAEPTAERMTADPQARRAAYATGRMLDGSGGLGDIPIVDYRAYTDDLPHGDIHMRYQSFSTADRLIEANGDADNQVMLVEDDSRGLFDSNSPVLTQALEQMDRWIRAVQRDRSGRDPHDVVVDAKPRDLVDACWTPDDEKIAEPQTYDGDTRCNQHYPSFASPRIVAGGPVASDVITCQLRGPDRVDYPSAMTDARWQRLNAIFPNGVCDWTRPGVDESAIEGTWLFFSAPGRWSNQPG